MLVEVGLGQLILGLVFEVKWFLLELGLLFALLLGLFLDYLQPGLLLSLPLFVSLAPVELLLFTFLTTSLERGSVGLETCVCCVS